MSKYFHVYLICLFLVEIFFKLFQKDDKLLKYFSIKSLSILWWTKLRYLNIKHCFKKVCNLNLKTLLWCINHVLHKMIEEWISFLALSIAHHKAVDIGNWNVNAGLERNDDFHWVYFHLVEFCNLVHHLIVGLDFNHVFYDFRLHSIVFLVELNQFFWVFLVFFFIQL